VNLVLLGPDGGEGARYTLANGETIIGRRPDCRIVLDAPSIAPRHARLFSVDGHSVIYTIDEAWPVYVNDTPVERQVLVAGDDIELGHYRMRYGDTAAPSTPLGEEQSQVAPDLPDTGNEDDDAGAPDPLQADDQEPTASDAGSAGDPPSESPADASGPGPGKSYHLDILTGINRGRRVALSRDRVVLGFNQEPLVELRNADGALSLRRLAEHAAAELNGTPLAGEPAEAKPGDVISVQRIELRIHAREIVK